MLDEIERLFEVYRKTTDEAERAAIYHRIDSISYEASKIAIPNEYDKLMAAIGANGTNAFTSRTSLRTRSTTGLKSRPTASAIP